MVRPETYNVVFFALFLFPVANLLLVSILNVWDKVDKNNNIITRDNYSEPNIIEL